MGWVDGQYYEKHVKGEKNSCTYKLSMLTDMINKSNNFIDALRVVQAIKEVETQFKQDMKDVSKVNLKDADLDVPYTKINKEPIEYVIEETKEKVEEENER